MLRDEKLSYIQGTPVSSGFGRGYAVVAGGLSLPDIPDKKRNFSKDKEWNKVRNALKSLKTELSSRLDEPLNSTEIGVIKAHLSIVRDPGLSDKLKEILHEESNASAADAIIKTNDHFTSTLKTAESIYIRERVLDIQDVCSRLIKLIYGNDAVKDDVRFTRPSIIIAENLTPSRFLALDRSNLRGLVLSHGGTTSHTIILARSLDIPALTGVTDVQTAIEDGREVIIDAKIGILLTEINPTVERFYELEERKVEGRKNKLENLASKEAQTADTKRLEVAANIALPQEAQQAFDNYAEGIGLFRTEMLFMESGDRPPTEEEQYQVYRRVAEAAGKHPVIVRTLDVGGDKSISYLPIPAENNPFLGYRAVRFYADFPDLIQEQLRAIIRASTYGNIKVMIPMVSAVEEVKMVKEMVRDIQTECNETGISFDPDMQVGIMVEIPSVAFAMDTFAAEVDFFSIGTNDLAQYFFAADRENKKVSHLSSNLDPSFIRLLKKIVDDAHKYGKWVGMCGEMAGATQNLPLLAGLELDEISLGASCIPEMKSNLSNLNSEDCRNLVIAATECNSVAEVEQLLAEFPKAGGDISALDSELIITSSDSANKYEAIKELCDSLYINGRTANPSGIEEDVWKREQVYSTDMGLGIAIPHCKTTHTLANSIAVLKPETPIQWGSNDNKPVEVVILLAIRENEAKDAHMKIFAKLARKVMHEEFRDYLINENNPKKICEYLKQSLEIS
jgi:fructose-specific PTS system IIA-like component